MSNPDRVSLIHLAFYRLWRCKRLLVLVPVMILAAAVLAGQIGGLSSFYFEAEEVFYAGLIALSCTAIAVVLLPAAPLDVLFGGMAAAILILTEPWQGLVFAPADKGGDFTPLWLRAVMFGGAWIVLLTVLYAIGHAISARLQTKRRPLRYRLFVPGGNAAELRSFLDLRPESTSGLVTYGERQWDGWVPARLFIRSHDADYKISDIHLDYSVKALRSEGDTDVFAIRDTNGEREVHGRFRATRRGAWIEIEERPGPHGPLVMLSLKLNEGGPDILRARVDYHLGRPSPATVLRPMRSFLCMLAWLTHVPGPKRKSDQPAE